MQKGLISIITPCYNTGRILHRLLDSVLKQDYPCIEMYAINDGSTDDTEDIIKSYIPKFESKGYSLKYIYQKNGGQSAALNNGLKYVNGEYLIWPDSDDFFRRSDSLSCFVDALNSKGDYYGVVRCIPVNVNEDTLEEEPNQIRSNPDYYNENQFENCLYSKNFFWGAGDYLIRTKCFDEVNPMRKIYVEKNAGQNWQILLPVLYTSKCLTIDDPLFCVLVRSSSHSRGQYKTYFDNVLKFDCYLNTITHTIDGITLMPNDTKVYYKRKVFDYFKIKQLELAIKYKETNDIVSLSSELKRRGSYPNSLQRLSWKYENNRILRFLLHIFNKLQK